MRHPTKLVGVVVVGVIVVGADPANFTFWCDNISIKIISPMQPNFVAHFTDAVQARLVKLLFLRLSIFTVSPLSAQYIEAYQYIANYLFLQRTLTVHPIYASNCNQS